MMVRKSVFGIAFAAGVACAAAGVQAGQEAPPPLRVRWISAREAVVPGEAFDMAFHFEMQPGWHTYWSNPGDGGIPLMVAWSLPAGIEVLTLEWPVPEVFDDAGIISYGFEGTVTVPFKVLWTDAWSGGATLKLAARLEWMACLEYCVGGEEHLTWEGDVGTQAVAGEQVVLIEETRARLPVEDAAWRFSAVADNDRVRLFVCRDAEGATAIVRAGRFFAARQSVVRPSDVPRWRDMDTDLPHILLQRDPFGPAALERLEGVFVPAAGRAVWVDVPIASHGPDKKQEQKP